MTEALYRMSETMENAEYKEGRRLKEVGYYEEARVSNLNFFETNISPTNSRDLREEEVSLQGGLVTFEKGND
ncbi:hypothetical protein Fmac_011014 [Flemingia macrophylla]|uniref:Uncharacterized protein n=1 Tax=Flemingia macrophylla TaxID=520843 RepID=A0ABD1ML84_9FABA